MDRAPDHVPNGAPGREGDGGCKMLVGSLDPTFPPDLVHAAKKTVVGVEENGDRADQVPFIAAVSGPRMAIAGINGGFIISSSGKETEPKLRKIPSGKDTDRPSALGLIIDTRKAVSIHSHTWPPSKTPAAVQFDPYRSGLRIVADPRGRFLAVSDGYARISIWDSLRMVAVRWLRGYRDAQCGWLIANSSTDQKRRKRMMKMKKKVKGANGDEEKGVNEVSSGCGLYLVVYVARRGLLEAWAISVVTSTEGGGGGGGGGRI
eukprot:jgi/Bigna1/133090/aug1.20_g7798